MDNKMNRLDELAILEKQLYNEIEVIPEYIMIKNQIDYYAAERETIINDCVKSNHNKQKVKRIHKGNTGNYDPSSDCYWDVCECLFCGHKWTEEIDSN